MCIWSDTRQVFKKDVEITSFFKRSWGNCEEQLLDDNIVTKRLETVVHLLPDCNGQQMSLKLLAESQSSVGQQLPNSPPTDSPQVFPRSCSISYLFVSFKTAILPKKAASLMPDFHSDSDYRMNWQPLAPITIKTE